MKLKTIALLLAAISFGSGCVYSRGTFTPYGVTEGGVSENNTRSDEGNLPAPGEPGDLPVAGNESPDFPTTIDPSVNPNAEVSLGDLNGLWKVSRYVLINPATGEQKNLDALSWILIEEDQWTSVGSQFDLKGLWHDTFAIVDHTHIQVGKNIGDAQRNSDTLTLHFNADAANGLAIDLELIKTNQTAVALTPENLSGRWIATHLWTDLNGSMVDFSEVDWRSNLEFTPTEMTAQMISPQAPLSTSIMQYEVSDPQTIKASLNNDPSKSMPITIELTQDQMTYTFTLASKTHRYAFVRLPD